MESQRYEDLGKAIETIVDAGLRKELEIVLRHIESEIEWIWVVISDKEGE